MNFLVLDEDSRLILRLFLSDRERLHNIDYMRWAELKSASTEYITHNEIAEIMDCFGPKIMDLLLLPLETKKAMLTKPAILDSFGVSAKSVRERMRELGHIR